MRLSTGGAGGLSLGLHLGGYNPDLLVELCLTGVEDLNVVLVLHSGEIAQAIILLLLFRTKGGLLLLLLIIRRIPEFEKEDIEMTLSNG